MSTTQPKVKCYECEPGKYEMKPGAIVPYCKEHFPTQPKEECHCWENGQAKELNTEGFCKHGIKVGNRNTSREEIRERFEKEFGDNKGQTVNVMDYQKVLAFLIVEIEAAEKRVIEYSFTTHCSCKNHTYVTNGKKNERGWIYVQCETCEYSEFLDQEEYDALSPVPKIINEVDEIPV